MARHRTFDHDEVRHLWTNEYTAREIASILGMSRSMVYLILNDASYEKAKASSRAWSARKRADNPSAAAVRSRGPRQTGATQ